MTQSQVESGHSRHPVRGGRALLCLLFTAVVQLAIGTIRLALLAVTPVLALALVAVALAGLGIAVLFGGLLHFPSFHALPVFAISAVCLGLVMALYKLIDLLRPR